MADYEAEMFLLNLHVFEEFAYLLIRCDNSKAKEVGTDENYRH